MAEKHLRIGIRLPTTALLTRVTEYALFEMLAPADLPVRNAEK